jgi:hydroxymethylpyrimidine/phosphomethylpyrimidine kinase
MPAAARVLVIAATDSSGGAGLTRDLQTLTAFRTEASCAVTAVTAQTDAQLRGVWPMTPECVAEQIRAALASAGVGAIKIGMLASASIVQAVVEALPAHGQLPIVLDPVLVSSSGGTLLDEAGTEQLCRRLLPRVSLVTPNLPEAAALLGLPMAQGQLQMLEQMRALRTLGASAVLLKGGHAARGADSLVTDGLLTAEGETVWLRTPRVEARRRGTGCSLASAIAAQLAAGMALPEACAIAQRYVASALRGDPWQAQSQGGTAPR